MKQWLNLLNSSKTSLLCEVWSPNHHCNVPLQYNYHGWDFRLHKVDSFLDSLLTLILFNNPKSFNWSLQLLFPVLKVLKWTFYANSLWLLVADIYIDSRASWTLLIINTSTFAQVQQATRYTVYIIDISRLSFNLVPKLKKWMRQFIFPYILSSRVVRLLKKALRVKIAQQMWFWFSLTIQFITNNRPYNTMVLE